jgi:tetratricopeptide (TPR) repeat protein
MKTTFFRTCFFAAGLLALAAPAVAQTAVEPAPAVSSAKPTGNPDNDFSLGLAAYDKGDYATARDYFAFAGRSVTSPALEFDWGNACFQTKDMGGAILHYLRALALDPRDPDARANLSLARQALGVNAPESTRLDLLSNWMSVNGWTWLATLFGWTALYLLLLPRLYGWGGKVPWLLFAGSIAVTIVAAFGLWGTHLHARDGVTLRADTQLKLLPTANSQPIGMLQAGDIAQTLRQHGDYYYVRSPDGTLGWVQGNNYEPVR